MNPNDFDLTEASRSYGVANTPPFLVRKLQADPVVRAISEKCSPLEILDAIRSTVSAEAESPLEAVRPYAFLTALWFKPEIEHLQEAAKIDAPTCRWFVHVASILLETFSPVQGGIIEVPGQLASPSVSMGSPALTIVIANN